MKTIKEWMDEIAKKRPSLGNYIGLAEWVKMNKPTQAKINQMFELYVPKDQYVKSEKDELLTHLYGLAAN